MTELKHTPWIELRAQEIAHENSPACKNRPTHFAKGHGKSCKALAKTISAAMQEAVEKAEAPAMVELLERLSTDEPGEYSQEVIGHYRHIRTAACALLKRLEGKEE